jgi:hypothetical protein
MRISVSMRRSATAGMLAAALLSLAAAPSFAQTRPAPPPPGPTPAPPPPLEPAALDRLKAMSDLLKSAPRFTFKAVSDRETPSASTSGQMLDFVSVSKVTVERPNKVRVDTTGDRFAASLWYDGKTLTIFSEKSAFYAQVAAPATIDEAVQMLLDRLDTPLPIAGFLLADPYAKMMEGVKTAFDAGGALLEGSSCRHFAFSEPDADWQLWIEDGAKPLPRRLAVTYKKVPGSPRVLALMSDWNLSPTIPADAFTFTPPAGATKVEWRTTK